MEMVMTNENRPKVAKVIGKLISFNTGLTNEFKKAIIKATNKAVVKVSTVIPFKYFGITSTSVANIKYRMMNPSMLFFVSFLQ